MHSEQHFPFHALLSIIFVVKKDVCIPNYMNNYVGSKCQVCTIVV